MCFVFKRNGEGNHSRRGVLDSNSYPIYTSAICSPRKTTFTYLHNAGVISVTISLSIYVLRYACHKASGRKGNWKCGSIFSITIIPAIVSPLFNSGEMELEGKQLTIQLLLRNSSRYKLHAMTENGHGYQMCY